MVNKNLKQISKSIGTFRQIDPSHLVAFQLTIFILEGTVMIMVAGVK
jgi:hypothetical protein